MIVNITKDGKRLSILATEEYARQYIEGEWEVEQDIPAPAFHISCTRRQGLLALLEHNITKADIESWLFGSIQINVYKGCGEP